MSAPQDDPLVAQAYGLLVATADHRGDAALDENVHKVLAVLRSRMKMDVVFVSRFENGQRIFKAVDAAPRTAGHVRPGHGDPLEESWCHRIVNGRLPQYIHDAAPLVESGEAPPSGKGIGTHLSVPVVLSDGQVFGTLCAFAFHVNEDVSLQDVWRLRAVADLIAKRIEPDKA
ncbi:GAF domain-containing protein [Ramlibacter albus]|uniref:GAF domain-containing protein n=1 Tax=Ramlibacter albus TaxID=2079448 RepID=A0A923MAD9_9BURK|nr:GAF domain-containing protein [Ramlibacter albus]MBC5765704.1 GAF domain-containing protein [Ramlibacter albus]